MVHRLFILCDFTAQSNKVESYRLRDRDNFKNVSENMTSITYPLHERSILI